VCSSDLRRSGRLRSSASGTTAGGTEAGRAGLAGGEPVAAPTESVNETPAVAPEAPAQQQEG